MQAATRPEIQAQLRSGALWILALFLVEMFPIPVWRDIRITFGYPLIMFLAVLYQPAAVGLFVLLGSGDPREFTGASDLLRSAFNRSQVAAAAYVASSLFHSAVGTPRLGPVVLAVAAAACVAELLVNMTLVSLAAWIDYRVPFLDVIRKMPVGNPWLFEMAYIGLGILGAVMALVYIHLGVWAVVGLLPPLISLRHMLQVSKTLEAAQSTIEHEAALKEVSEQLATERHQERQRLAATIHDELSPLLMSTSMRIESAVNDLKEQHPDLVEKLRPALASGRTAQATARAMIGELLQSPTGPNGLSEALRRLLTELGAKHGLVFRHFLESIEAPHMVNELLFGIARETARNAINHGEARTIELTLRDIDGIAVLTVFDDGHGFDPLILRGERGGDHYGLRLLRERTETIGGRLTVFSSPGRGTVVTAEIPMSPDLSLPDRPLVRSEADYHIPL